MFTFKSNVIASQLHNLCSEAVQRPRRYRSELSRKCGFDSISLFAPPLEIKHRLGRTLRCLQEGNTAEIWNICEYAVRL